MNDTRTMRSKVLSAGLAVGLLATPAAIAVAGAAPAAACSPAARVAAADTPADCDPVGTPITLGEPTPGATDGWQATATNGVGYQLPADWTGRAISGDGGDGHEWESPEVAVSDEFGDLHWRVLVQSPFFDQRMPRPAELNRLGFHASYVEVEGASKAVLVAAQTGHWADASVETIDFQLFVKSAETRVVTRFMGELPAGEEGQFLLDNFVPTVQP
ncbi:hypothetical protein [Myceligenerans crystallogenes]|uniref:Uncharacterized protein n=1 Tax=Myceligenerans crystallogenes TaxID=316335 RepID=A0ABN2NGU9_9MICO